MDNTDIKIINILQENCKTSTREIGQKVGLTAPAVAERINRLKDAGVIEGFHAQINETLLGSNISAYALVNVPPKEYEPFCRFCENDPSIVEHHHIVGLNNVLIKMRVGNAQDLEVLLDKNPEVRIVINCITLETVTEAMNAIRDFSLTDVDIVQLSAARSKSIGRYHMMMGENPIYIISCSGRGEEI